MSSHISNFIKDKRFLSEDRKEQWYFFRLSIHKIFYQMSPKEKNVLIVADFDYMQENALDEEKYNVLAWARSKVLGHGSNYTKTNNEWIQNLRNNPEQGEKFIRLR